MTDYGTIKIPRDEYEQHNERRQELGLSWSEYINGEAPEVSNNAEGGPVELEASERSKIAREVVEALR